jgi:hypothetical protein
MSGCSWPGRRNAARSNNSQALLHPSSLVKERLAGCCVRKSVHLGVLAVYPCQFSPFLIIFELPYLDCLFAEYKQNGQVLALFK